MRLRRIDLRKRVFALAGMTADQYLKAVPSPDDCSRQIPPDSQIYVDGVPAGFSVTLDETVSRAFRTALTEIEFSTGGARTNGLVRGDYRVIGYQPRVPVRRDFCGAAGLSKDLPTAHAILCSGAKLATELMEKHSPAQFRRQEDLVGAKVKGCWTIPMSFFTSGICNRNNPLRYHYDAGNLPGTWNAMLCLRKDIEGGNLAVPQLDAEFVVSDSTLIVFDAQGFMHGVTPFRKLSPRAYRYTVVYYALAGMCLCGTPAEELERIRRVKTERETRRKSK